ncbi:MAG: hypothetical protein M1820_002730 [Bogoriella megaspora]|nr:MAG: hypothetical protein M1820_002730 [Bogoriella megaspora]
MDLLLLLTILATAVLSAAQLLQPRGPQSAVAQKHCGGSAYNPTDYQCYDTDLCPVVNGDILKRCGTACYSQYNYTCSADHALTPLPHAIGPFILQVLSSDSNLDGHYVQACTQKFWIGEGPCTFCPEDITKAGQCPTATQTQLFEGHGMNVAVPGGQRYYLNPDGAFSYTVAHSNYTPPHAIVGSTAYTDGMFIYENVKYPPATWIACPKMGSSTLDGGQSAVKGTWQIFAQLKGVEFRKQQGCVGVTLLAKSGEKETVGAWEYT